MWKRLKQAWAIYRHFAAAHGLLQTLGLWQYFVAAGALIVGAVVGWIVNVPLWGKFLFGLFTIVGILLLGGFGMILRRVSRESRNDAVPVNLPLSENVEGGPYIVVDYFYEERRRWPDTANSDPEAPITLKNISSTSSQAFNITVLPVELPEGRLQFEPFFIPYLQAGQTAQVFGDNKDAGALLRRRIPSFFRRTYRDSSVDELFGEKSFTIRIQYSGEDSRAYESSCELLYRPWHDRIRTGKINRVRQSWR